MSIPPIGVQHGIGPGTLRADDGITTRCFRVKSDAPVLMPAAHRYRRHEFRGGTHLRLRSPRHEPSHLMSALVHLAISYELAVKIERVTRRPHQPCAGLHPGK
jgi:hypothetical protein